MTSLPSPSQIYSYAMAAWFLNKLTNFQWSVGSSGAGARPGSLFSVADVNNVLHGSYLGVLTEPQLTYGDQNGSWTVPLYIYSNDWDFNNGDGLKWSNRLQAKWVSSKPASFDTGSVKTNYPNVSYITINRLANKVHQWLGLNGAGAPSPTEKPVDYVSITSPDYPGPQLELINATGLIDDKELQLAREFSSSTDDIDIFASYTTPASNQSLNLSRYTFTYDGGNELFTISYALTNQSSTTISQAVADTGSHSVANTWNIKIGSKTKAGGDVLGVKGEVEAAVEESYGQTYTDLTSKTITYTDSELKSTTTSQTISLAVNTSGWEAGQKFSELSGLVGSAQSSPNLSDYTLQLGSEYTITFEVTTAQSRLSAGGASRVTGVPGILQPKTLFWNVNGSDQLKEDYSVNIETAVRGNNSVFGQFVNKGGKVLFDLQSDDGSDPFTYDDIGFTVKNIAGTEMSTDASAVYVMRARSAGPGAPLSLALRSEFESDGKVRAGRKLLDGNNMDLSLYGEDGIGDHYEGSTRADYVLGDSEGGDLIETADGNDFIAKAVESSIFAGTGGDTIKLSRGFGGNYIELGDGKDEVLLESAGNVVRDGLSRDVINIRGRNNAVLLADDHAPDKVALEGARLRGGGSRTVIDNFELGEDSITGLPMSRSVSSLEFDGGTSRIRVGYEGGAVVDIYLDLGQDTYDLSNAHLLFLAALESGTDRNVLERIIRYSPHSIGAADALVVDFLKNSSPFNGRKQRTLGQYSKDIVMAFGNRKARRVFVDREADGLLETYLVADRGVATALVRSSLEYARSIALDNEAWTEPEAYSYCLQSNLLNYIQAV